MRWSHADNNSPRAEPKSRTYSNIPNVTHATGTPDVSSVAPKPEGGTDSEDTSPPRWILVRSVLDECRGLGRLDEEHEIGLLEDAHGSDVVLDGRDGVSSQLPDAVVSRREQHPFPEVPKAVERRLKLAEHL